MICAIASLAIGVVFAHKIRYQMAYGLAWLGLRAGPLTNPLLWLSQLVDNPEV